MTRMLLAATVAPTLSAFLLPVVRHVRELGWQVDAMAQGISTCPEPLHDFDQTWEVKWSRNPLDPRNLLRTPSLIRRLVEREGYDLVQVHTPVAAFVIRYALRNLRRTGRPKVIYGAYGFHFYQGGSPLRNYAFRTLEKMAGRWTDYLVVVNREDQRAAEQYGILPADRIYYMPGQGVDTERYRPEAVSPAQVQCVRAEMGLESEDKLLLMVAEFIRRKRHKDAIQAFARLRRPDAHLALAGDGVLTDDMKALAQELGVGDRVHFLGYRTDVPVLVRASVALVLPSEQEGLPQCVGEALSLARPVIGSNIRGTRDLLQDGCGLLFRLGDIEDLARAMAWVIDHPDEAESMGRQGREQMAAFDIRCVLDLYYSLYKEIINGKSI